MKIASANPYVFRPQTGDWDPWASARPELNRGIQSIADSKRLPNLAKKLALGTVGGIATAGIAPALFGGGGVAATTGGPAAATTAGAPSVASGGFSLGRILNSPLAGLGVNAFTSLLGMRSANKQNKYAADLNAQGLTQQLALERERLENERREIAATREEDKRRWEAEEAYRVKQAADQEQERQYVRQRRARYDPMRERALRTVGSILGF